ncbi:hypothetical protein QVD17_00630 [Tagetes erecta]|uniref:Uncharacterized protein n=1 Tax=Tagetes erecta TaxID=13708 RepID=A0AAD8L906_TARER|nr:hypothetical protein QVD17_00630 [Tagetes erecta]
MGQLRNPTPRSWAGRVGLGPQGGRGSSRNTMSQVQVSLDHNIRTHLLLMHLLCVLAIQSFFELPSSTRQQAIIKLNRLVIKLVLQRIH